MFHLKLSSYVRALQMHNVNNLSICYDILSIDMITLHMIKYEYYVYKCMRSNVPSQW